MAKSKRDSNDSLVAAALVWGLALMFTPLMRGLALGMAIAAKFGPAVLLVLWWRRPFPRRGDAREPWRFAMGLGLAALLTGWVLLLDGDDGVRAFWSRTIGYQLDRDSPFSIWGQNPGLRPLQLASVTDVDGHRSHSRQLVVPVHQHHGNHAPRDQRLRRPHGGGSRAPPRHDEVPLRKLLLQQFHRPRTEPGRV